MADEQRLMLRYLMVLTVGSVVGLQARVSLLNNFAVEMAGLKGKQVDAIQSARDILGFLTFACHL